MSNTIKETHFFAISLFYSLSVYVPCNLFDEIIVQIKGEKTSVLISQMRYCKEM